MPELNSIDDFFRRKERESSERTDTMTTHWKQMSELLKTSPAPTAPVSRPIFTRKILLYAAAIVLLAVAGSLLILSNKQKQEQTKRPVTESTNTKQLPVTTISPINDSTPVIILPAKAGSITAKNVRTGASTLNTHLAKQEKIQAEIDTITAIFSAPNKIDDKKLFTTFFDHLEKPAQEFEINTSKDTMIVSKEGTQLTVPANAFLNSSGQPIRGVVKIFLQEFYSFKDIVGNKLTTMSDDRPLITGGMFNIIAKAGSEQVQINPKQPLTLDIPTETFDPFMQLFTGQEASAVVTADAIKKELPIKDILISASPTGINWTAAGQEQYSMVSTKNRDITILNLRDNPYSISYGKRTVGRFEIPYDSKLSKEEIKAELERRYSKWYDVIKVKKQWRPWAKKNRVPSKDEWYESAKVGDSIVISLALATKLKMISPDDSVAYEAEFKRQYELAVKQQNARSEWLQVKDKYRFTITGLGWINCDRFWDYRNKRVTDFVLNPGAGFSGSYLYSVLIFHQMNSIMPGQWVNGKIVFQRIPINEYVSVVSIGVKDGKTWACIQPMYVRPEEMSKMMFEEITPDQLKRKLERFGNVNDVN